MFLSTGCSLLRAEGFSCSMGRGIPRGDAQDARASPFPPCESPPPQPERLVMRKDEAVGNKKKNASLLPNHNYN